MELRMFFILSTRRIFPKLVAISEILIKIKVKLHEALFIILLISAIICEQRLLHGNKIVQYFQNCKCYNVGPEHFRKPL